MASSRLSTLVDVLIPVAIAIGSGVWAWCSLQHHSASQDQDLLEKGFVESFTADLTGRETPDDIDGEQQEREQADTDDINYSISEERVSIPKDLNYVVDLLEKQEFAVQMLQKQVSDSVPSWAADLMKINSDLAEELRRLRRPADLSSNDHATLSSQTQKENFASANITDPSIFPEIPSRLGVDRAIATMIQSNQDREDSLKAGSKMLSMYLKNIIEHPGVSRYLKVAKANESFQSLVKPLIGHEEVFLSLGFTDKGNHFIIALSIDKKKDLLDILQHGFHLLSILVEKGSLTSKSSELDLMAEITADA